MDGAAAWERDAVCRQLHLDGVGGAHHLVTSALADGVDVLQDHGLNAYLLKQIGYSLDGMQRLGFDEVALRSLGYFSPGGVPPPPPKKTEHPAFVELTIPDPEVAEAEPPPAEETAHSEDDDSDGHRQRREPHHDHERVGAVDYDIKEMVDEGVQAAELRRMGITLHHCKSAGLSAAEIRRAGFALDEMAQTYRPAELLRAGFSPRQLGNRFGGHQLKSMGLSARDLRVAGMSARDLKNFGFPDSRIVTAGFSAHDLERAGVKKH